MPITATSAKGSINVALELVPGMVQLLAPTVMTSGTPITAITAPTSVTGMRFYIKVVAWTASGSLAISGTGSPGNTETATIAAPTTQQTQSPQLASFDYLTTNVYTAITSITPTNLTNAIITVWGVQGGKYQLPGTMKSKRTPKIYSPNEHNTLIERDKKVVQLIQETTIDEIKQDVYSNLSLWWPYLMMGTPTAATIPASPTSLKASTAVSGGPFSLTTQPTAPGMILIFAVTASSATGTIVVQGTERYSNATVTETITCNGNGTNGNGTYYSSNVYSAVAASGVSFTGLTSGSVAITGVYGWDLTFKSGVSPYSAVMEWYDGTGSWAHPFVFGTDGTFDAKVQTEIAVTLKGMAQDKIPIGSRTTDPLTGVNRIAALGVNLGDLPIVSWQSALYIDPITGTAGTTANVNVEEFKLDLKVPQEHHFTFTNSQNFNRVYPVKRSGTATLSLDFTNMLLYEQFRQQLKQYLYVQFQGELIGINGTSPVYKSWTWTLPIKSDGSFDVTSDPTKGSVMAATSWQCEYDSGIGGSYQLDVITQVPPANYPL